jgi:soluble lytic murein transglycosylase-like protein
MRLPPYPADSTGVRLALVLAVSAIAAGQDSIALQRASLEKQAASVRVQTAVFRRPAEPPAPPRNSCGRGDAAEIRGIVDEGARESGLDRELVRAVVRQESAYDPCAVSSAGAQGLMQLMPATQTHFGVADPFDPRQNVTAGTRFLKQLLESYKGDLSLALAAYNAGPGRVGQYGGAPPYPETMRYVSEILGRLPK